MPHPFPAHRKIAHMHAPFLSILHTNGNQVLFFKCRQCLHTSKQDGKHSKQRVDEKRAESYGPVIAWASPRVRLFGHNRQNVWHARHSVCRIQAASAAIQQGARAQWVATNGWLGPIALHPDFTQLWHTACFWVTIVIGWKAWVWLDWCCHFWPLAPGGPQNNSW